MALKSCKYCGRIHPARYDCPSKPKRTKKDKEPSIYDKERSTSRWQKKRAEIRVRDNNVCQVCIRNLYHTFKKLTYTKLGVHHITPMEEDETKWYDNDELILLCTYHHEMAENSEIPREVLRKIVKQQSTPPFEAGW